MRIELHKLYAQGTPAPTAISAKLGGRVRRVSTRAGCCTYKGRVCMDVRGRRVQRASTHPDPCTLPSNCTWLCNRTPTSTLQTLLEKCWVPRYPLRVARRWQPKRSRRSVHLPPLQRGLLNRGRGRREDTPDAQPEPSYSHSNPKPRRWPARAGHTRCYRRRWSSSWVNE